MILQRTVGGHDESCSGVVIGLEKCACDRGLGEGGTEIDCLKRGKEERVKRKTMDRRENNIRIFQDTEQMCKNNNRLIEAIDSSKCDQYVLMEEDSPGAAGKSGGKTGAEGVEHRFGREAAKVVVSKRRSFEAASVYAWSGEKVCVHNFASATNPGGGNKASNYKRQRTAETAY